MGQSNSKQGAGAVSDENRLLYPIGGGHVGEGPVYVNPIAEGSQQQLPRTQEKPGQLQPEPGSAVPASAESQSKEISSSGPTAISNPVFEDDSVPANGASPAEGLSSTATAPNAEGQSKGASIPSSTATELPAAKESAVPAAGVAGSPVREKAGGEEVVVPKTPEGVVPPPTTAKHGPLYSSMPTYIRLGSEEPGQSAANGEAAGGAVPGQTTTHTHSSSSKTQESSSSSSHQVVSGGTLPELKTEQPLQADNSLDRPPAPPNTPLVQNTSEITPDDGVPDTSLPPGSSIKGGLGSSERGISKAVLDASKDYDKPVAGPSSVQEPASKAAAVDEPSPAVEKPSPAVEEPSPAAAATSAPIKTRPLTQTSPPAEAVSTPAETAPIAAATPRGATKMGNTGSLVNQEEKVQPGCLCFSAPGSKKGKKQKETIGTDAPIYAGPAATGVAIGGGSLYDAKAAEPETVVATSTATQPATEEESALNSETAKDTIPPAVEEEEPAPTTANSASKTAPPVAVGALSTTSPVIPTKIDTPATVEPATAEPATAEPATAEPAGTTSRDDTGSSHRAVPIPVPVVIPTSGAQHSKNLSQEEAAVLPPLQETSNLPHATPGSTTVVGGVAALPTGGSTSKAAPIAEEPPAAAAEPGVATGAVLPQGAAAADQKETAPVYEEPTGTVGGDKLVNSPAVAPETETGATSGAALAAPLTSKPPLKKAVSFKEDSLPSASTTAAETPAVAEKEAEPLADSTAEFTPATTAPYAAEEAPDSILLTPIQEGSLTKSEVSLQDTPPIDPGYLSSAEISEMPGIGRSVPATPEAEGGSVLVGGTEEPKTLTEPEEQIIDSQEQALPASQTQGHADERNLPSAGKDTTAVAGVSGGPAVVESGAASPSAGVTSAESTITDQGAAEEATDSALAAGASAGAVNAAAAAPVGKQLSAKQSKKLERQASKREAHARSQALKEKEKADKTRFKEKRKEERAHKKEQAKRMQQERQQAGPGSGGGGGGSRTTVGVFGFLSRPKKEEKKKEEEETSVTPESQAVGDAAIAAGPSQPGRGAAGAGLSGPASALGATGTSRSNLGASGDPSGVETGSNASGYLASQGIGAEGESSRAPEGTPEVISLEDATATAEGPSTEVAPTETAPATPGQVEEPVPGAETEGEIAPLPVSTPEPVPSSLRAVEEPAGPQDVAVIFAHNEPIGETTPIKDGEATAEAPAEAPLTPPQDKEAARVGVLAALMPKKKEKQPKAKKVKTQRNIDYSAIQMQKVPESKLQDGFNPTTRQYDTTQGKRVAPGAFSPLRASQPVVQQSAKLAKQDTLKRKKSRKMNANDVIPLLPSRTMAPAGRGIERPEASANKADYRPLSRSFA